MNAPIAITTLKTPIGWIELSADANWLLGVRIGPSVGPAPQSHANPLLQAAVAQMQGWFDGSRRDFSLPLKPLTSPRGEHLRAAIAAIPYGTTLTYGRLAAQMGSAARAVGGACRTNAFPILIPCHRVVSSGATEFYSGGDGPRTKAWLIAFEQGKSLPYDSFDPNDQPRLL
jgi:methylated-DNA-[protein]-cysteine S-methyltransferase